MEAKRRPMVPDFPMREVTTEERVDYLEASVRGCASEFRVEWIRDDVRQLRRALWCALILAYCAALYSIKALSVARRAAEKRK